jgi:hypothetical protein
MKKIIAIFLFISITNVAFANGDSAEEASLIELLQEQDYRSLDRHEKITFIQKVNMGIPVGENYLVEWNNHSIIFYNIDQGKVIKRIICSPNFNPAPITKFNIMKDIPGIRIGDGATTVGDFNGDGVDEILSLLFGGSSFVFEISGYDFQTDMMKVFCSIRFDIVDSENGPAPIEFITYKGMKGFMIYFDLYNGKPKHPPKNIIDGYSAWYFFAWDEESASYQEIEEIDPSENIGQEALKYFMQDYTVEYFKQRIELEFGDNLRRLQEIVEIEPEILGGRTFDVIWWSAPRQASYHDIYNFDTDGRITLSSQNINSKDISVTEQPDVEQLLTGIAENDNLIQRLRHIGILGWWIIAGAVCLFVFVLAVILQIRKRRK